MCSSAAQSNDDDLPTILAKVAAGTLSPAMATDTLAPLLVSGGARAEDVGGYAKIDHDRHRRTGFPEVIFGEGKSAQHIVEILQAMVRDGAASAQEGMESPIVATRVSPEKWTAISATGLLPAARYHADARIVFIEGVESKGDTIGKVAVLSAGTSDLCVAEEAAVLAELAGAEVSTVCCIIWPNREGLNARELRLHARHLTCSARGDFSCCVILRDGLHVKVTKRYLTWSNTSGCST